jgi:hypothetical protein
MRFEQFAGYAPFAETFPSSEERIGCRNATLGLDEGPFQFHSVYSFVPNEGLPSEQRRSPTEAVVTLFGNPARKRRRLPFPWKIFSLYTKSLVSVRP